MSLSIRKHEQEGLPHVITKEDIDRKIEELDILFEETEHKLERD
ncbi:MULTISPECIES: hypothetical protein [Gracilibacillus]|nr:hypothetical protein [Gracilibacillus dipsosauri]